MPEGQHPVTNGFWRERRTMAEGTGTKKEIRRRVRELRKQMAPEELNDRSRKIFEKVRATEEYQSAEAIFAYMAMPLEIQTREFIEKAWADGKKVAVPKTDMESHQIHFYYIENFGQVKPGVMGIPEPVTEDDQLQDQEQKESTKKTGGSCSGKGKPCLCADSDERALMIMPGVAFDQLRHRIGYGGGFYDRYLQAHPEHPTIAVALDFQIFDQVPAKEYDIVPAAIIKA